jgi:hypothetical protein
MNKKFYFVLVGIIVVLPFLVAQVLFREEPVLSLKKRVERPRLPMRIHTLKKRLQNMNWI